MGGRLRSVSVNNFGSRQTLPPSSLKHVRQMKNGLDGPHPFQPCAPRILAHPPCFVKGSHCQACAAVVHSPLPQYVGTPHPTSTTYCGIGTVGLMRLEVRLRWQPRPCLGPVDLSHTIRMVVRNSSAAKALARQRLDKIARKGYHMARIPYQGVLESSKVSNAAGRRALPRIACPCDADCSPP